MSTFCAAGRDRSVDGASAGRDGCPSDAGAGLWRRLLYGSVRRVSRRVTPSPHIIEPRHNHARNLLTGQTATWSVFGQEQLFLLYPGEPLILRCTRRAQDRHGAGWGGGRRGERRRDQQTGHVPDSGLRSCAQCSRLHRSRVLQGAHLHNGLLSLGFWTSSCCKLVWLPLTVLIEGRNKLLTFLRAVRPLVPSYTAGPRGRAEARRLPAAGAQPHGDRQPVTRLHAAQVRDAAVHGSGRAVAGRRQR